MKCAELLYKYGPFCFGESRICVRVFGKPEEGVEERKKTGDSRYHFGVKSEGKSCNFLFYSHAYSKVGFFSIFLLLFKKKKKVIKKGNSPS